MDKNGKVIVKTGKYDYMESFDENGLAFVEVNWWDDVDGNEKIGVINTKGKEVVKPKYNSIEFIEDGLIVAIKNNKKEVINTEGKIIAKAGTEIIDVNII